MKIPLILLRSLEFVIHQNFHHDTITVSKLARSWSISTQISYFCRKVAIWDTPNMLQWMLAPIYNNDKNYNVYKTKRKKTIHTLLFTITNLKAYESRRVQCYPVNQFILATYCNFHILSYTLCTRISDMYFHTVLSMFPFFLLLIALENSCCSFKRVILIS